MAPPVWELLERLVGGLLQGLEPRQVVRSFLSLAAEALGIERVALFLYDAEGNRFRGEMLFGQGRSYTLSSLEIPIGAALDLQEAFFSAREGLVRGEEWLLPVVPDAEPFCWVAPEERCTAEAKATRITRAAVCIRCPRFRALGVLSLKGVPEEVRPWVPLVVRLTALALHNASLYERARLQGETLLRRNRVLDLVARFSREIVRGREVRAVLASFAQSLREIFGFYRITVALVQGGELHGVLTLKEGQLFWTEERTRIRLPLQSSDPLAQAARLRRALLVGPEALPEEVREGHTSMGIVPLVGYVPIKDQDDVLGILAVDHGPEGPPVSEAELYEVEVVAGVAAVALKNAEAYQALSDLSQALLSERERLQEVLGELQRREAWFRVLLEKSLDMVLVLSESGGIVYVTSNVDRVLGGVPGGWRPDADASVFLEHVHEEDREKAERFWQELLGSGSGRAVIRVRDKEGRVRWFEALGRDLRADPAVRALVVNLRDVSERMEAERIKEEFIAAVSHELRTPLGVIIGLAEVLQLSGLPPREQGHVDLILDSALRLKNMVDNLLDASRLEAGRFEIYRRPVDLAPVLAETARSFQALASLARVGFVVKTPPELPAFADPDRVAQVVANLLSNAFKFTPKGGEVRLQAREDGGWVELSVSDTGPGIPEEEIPHLFQKYYRARSMASRGAPGSGLGLYISKAIVEAHGGEIEVRSLLGQGTTFVVRLPRGGNGGADTRGG